MSVSVGDGNRQRGRTYDVVREVLRDERRQRGEERPPPLARERLHLGQHGRDVGQREGLQHRLVALDEGDLHALLHVVLVHVLRLDRARDERDREVVHGVCVEADAREEGEGLVEDPFWVGG